MTSCPVVLSIGETYKPWCAFSSALLWLCNMFQVVLNVQIYVHDYLQDILALLRSMYALTCMEEDASFLRYGYLSTENAAAVRKEVAKLCSELRPHALALVSSFGIPDAFLSPIAFNWVDANSWSSVQH